LSDDFSDGCEGISIIAVNMVLVSDNTMRKGNRRDLEW
jgi:hypothetical protein